MQQKTINRTRGPLLSAREKCTMRDQRHVLPLSLPTVHRWPRKRRIISF